MALMKHDRIVEFIGIRARFVNALDLEVDTFSIVMELMPLGTLRSVIKHNALKSWKIRKQIMEDICEACAFLHSSYYADGSPKRIILHQDLKSPNVLLLTWKGKTRAKIADFGLAFLKEISSDQSKNKSVAHNGGTLCYQAPELFKQNAKFSKVQISPLTIRNAMCLPLE
jgi:serine/threonine protein kinase